VLETAQGVPAQEYGHPTRTEEFPVPAPDPSSRRWPWKLSALLLAAAAVTAGLATYLFWLPCRGSMLRGSFLFPVGTGSEFSDACLVQMDTGTPFPFLADGAHQTWSSSQVAGVSIVLAALAWLPPAFGLGWRQRTRAALSLPVLATLLLAAATFPVARSTGFDSGSPGAVWLWLSVEVAGVAAVLAVGRWEPAAGGGTLVQLLALSWGTTAFGLVHQLFDYSFMITTSDSNWDVPPGTGYGTSAVLALSGVLTVLICLRRRPAALTKPPAGRPDRGLTLVDAPHR